MRVVDLLEVIEVDEQDGEFISKSRRTINLSFERLIKMARVVKPGAIIGDSQFLNYLEGTGILNGDCGIVAQRLQEKRLLRAEVCHVHIN